MTAKPFRLLWLTATLAALMLSVSACTSSPSAASSAMADSYAQSLYNSRVRYIGDNADVGSLLSQLGVDNRLGAFTIALQTKTEPYGLTLQFEQAPEDSAVFTDQFYYYADLLLALIDNCDQVSYRYPASDGSAARTLDWTTQEASDSLNMDVKSCGSSADGIATLLDTIHTVYADHPGILELYQDP